MMNEAWTSNAVCRAKLAMCLGGLSVWYAEYGKILDGAIDACLTEILGMYDPSRSDVFYLCCQIGSLMYWLTGKEGEALARLAAMLDDVAQTIDEGLAAK